MKLAAKTTLALVAVICAVLMVYGRYEVERQTAQLEAEIEQAQRALGRLFRPTIARAWRTDGQMTAMYLIEYTKQSLQEQNLESRLDLRWVWLDEAQGETDAHRPALPLAALDGVRAGEELTRTHVGPSGDDRMYTYVPLSVGIDGERPGALEVSGSLAPLREFTARTRRDILATIAALVATCAVLTLAVGAWFVARPVRRLVGAARRIGGGDLDTRVRLRQRDELGTLAREMNGMVAQLAQSRERAETEHQGKLLALRQMRHADRLATVGKLASGIAHELGTPLAVVSGRARLVADGTVTGDEAAHYAGSIARQADRMTHIIRQLLDFARRRPVTMSPKDLRPIVRQTVELLQPLADKRRVALVAELPADPIRANVDGSQLSQVLSNLIVNATQAMPDGGHVRLGVTLEEVTPPVDVAAPTGQYACCYVEDEGCGIPDEIVSRIFEPFFTTKSVGEGTGLGLSVSYGIVKDHGGWIDVASEPGRGTRFSIYLPRSAD